MSIIYDALKKMEAQRKAGKDKQATPQSSCDEQDSPEQQETFLAKIKKNRTLKLLGIFIILLIAFFFTYKNQIISLFSPAGRRKAMLQGRKIFGFQEDVTQIKVKPKVYEGYLLEGVIYDEQNPSAIINGKVLRKTDKIDDYTVVDISQDSVQLINRKDNKVLTLYLPL